MRSRLLGIAKGAVQKRERERDAFLFLMGRLFAALGTEREIGVEGMRDTKRSRRVVVALSLGVICLLYGALAAGTAYGARPHVFAASFGGEGSGPGQFKSPAGVAVNEETSDVYVVDSGNNRVEKFDAGGTFIGQFDGSGTFEVEGKVEHGVAALEGVFQHPEAVAVDNSTNGEDPSRGDVYVLDAGHNVVDKFTGNGSYLGEISGEGGGTFVELEERPVSVSVDPAGQVWVYVAGTGLNTPERAVDSYTDATTNEFVAARETFIIGSFATGQFAVDGEDNLYAGHEKEIAIFTSSGELEQLKIGEELATGVAVEAGTNQPYLADGQQVTRFTTGPSPEVVEQFGSGVLSLSEGIAVDGATGTVFVADAGTDLIDVFPLAEPGLPVVSSESVLKVTGQSAVLSADLDPRGAATNYHFEVGPCPAAAACTSSPYTMEVPIPDGTVATGFGAVSLVASVGGLDVGTTYHYRLTAENEFGETHGEERVLTTQGAGAAKLLDGRQWTLVSPPSKHGASIEPIGQEWLTQAATSGNAIAYAADVPTEAGVVGNSDLVSVLSTRRADGSWQTRDLTTPHEGETGIPVGYIDESVFFTSDLASSIVQPFGAFVPSSSPQALAPDEASEQTPFQRRDFAPGDPESSCEADCFRPVVTGAPGFANVPQGTQFGEEGRCPGEEGFRQALCGPAFVDATEDGKRVLLETHSQLTPTAVPNGGIGLYMWDSESMPADQLELVSLLPNGEPAENGALGDRNVNTRNALSRNGTRIVWTANPGHIYLRDTALHETIQIDKVQSGAGAGQAAPAFQLASADDGRIFFTDQQQLTEDSGAEIDSPDLYECAITVVSSHLGCTVSDLTPAVAGKPADVIGTPLGASEDGSYLYFVANGKLENAGVPVAGAVSGTCLPEHSPPGALCNLYVMHDGIIRLVAVLSGADVEDWARSSHPDLFGLTARVSPNGRWVAFMSQNRVTGYDNRDAVSGRPDQEVYLYDQEREKVVCASCNPSGGRPLGAEYVSLDRGLAGGNRVWPPSTWIAANIPGWTPFALNRPRHQPRYLSNDGRLFFNSSDTLVAKDSNGAQEDVYEYEPQEVGDCTSATKSGSAIFAPEAEGCVGLISSGGSGEESAFLDAGEGGNDVFLLTSAALAREDTDRSLDIYDAQVCSLEAPCPTPPAEPVPPCSTPGTCRALSPPVAEEMLPTTLLQMSGNLAISKPPNELSSVQAREKKLKAALRSCHRVKKHVLRKRCERHARARYGRATRHNASKRGPGRSSQVRRVGR